MQLKAYIYFVTDYQLQLTCIQLKTGPRTGSHIAHVRLVQHISGSQLYYMLPI